MNATKQTLTIKALQQQIKSLNIALSKSETELRAKTSKVITSLKKDNITKMKTHNSYHFCMTEFKDYIFKNIKNFKSFIHTDNENELCFKTEFKLFFMNRIRLALSDLDIKEKL